MEKNQQQVKSEEVSKTPKVNKKKVKYVCLLGRENIIVYEHKTKDYFDFKRLNPRRDHSEAFLHIKATEPEPKALLKQAKEYVLSKTRVLLNRYYGYVLLLKDENLWEDLVIKYYINKSFPEVKVKKRKYNKKIVAYYSKELSEEKED